MSECNHDCSSCSKSCSDRDPKSFLEKPHELSKIKHVIGVVSGKGGVGKSMVTSLLAVTMKRAGYNVAVLDADVTGPSVPQAFGIHEKAKGNEMGILPVTSKTGIELMSVNLLLPDETDPVVWRGPVISGTVKQFWTDVIWGDVDYMFVDMPPGTGDVPLTVFQSLPLDGIVIVTSPQDLVSMIVEKALKMARMMNVPVLGMVENMSYALCPDCGKRIDIFGESKLVAVSQKFSLPILGQLPINPKLAGAVDAGLIELFEGDWLADAQKVLENLKNEQ